MGNKAIEYLKSTKGELKHVSWPTRRQVFMFTVIVITISLFIAFILGLFDFGFSRFIKIIVS